MKEIIVPAAGESVTEADIASWHRSDGDYVNMDDPLLDLETDKATLEIKAEQSGVLRIKKLSGTVKVGDIIGLIEEGKKLDKQDTVIIEKKPILETNQKESNIDKKSTIPEMSYAKNHPSPAAESARATLGIDFKTIEGTGKDGRITKQDVLKAGTQTPASVPTKSDSPSREPRLEPMSRLRKTIMQKLVDTQHHAALLTTFNEIDMHAVMELRKRYKDKFKEKYQVNLGFMSFFTKAACLALKEYPIINASVEEDAIAYHDYCDIGIAVSTPKGLVVPVVRDADSMNLQKIESSILELALKSRDGKLTLQDMQGGTFTITNGGVFGSMLSTPIVNGPQSAILGMHNIVERPLAVNGQVLIRPVMYVALSYDHRIIDGSDAVRFLVKIKEYIEDPSRLLLEV